MTLYGYARVSVREPEEGPGAAAEVQAPPGGDDAAHAGRRRQPPADRCGLRVFPQHRPESAAAGRGGAMTEPQRTLAACRRDLLLLLQVAAQLRYPAMETD